VKEALSLKIKFSLFAGLILSSNFLLGCAGFPNQNIDPAKNNLANHKMDMRDCAQSYPETPDGVYLRRRISCMELKGWR
jgi:hypothetical protein